ncbi:helix-turn-helix domain-containing protein [Aquimarina rubra]|uniref:Helix-turn-helix domain-containing protein n=1 Tax=Aquimarina rubra TaxID=1920033 RepID=A0ABW5LBC6_9FLAO
MNYVTQILFFFGAIGVFNSFIISVYILFNKTFATLSSKLFGLFLLVVSLRILKSLFYAFSTEEPIWFLQSGPGFFLLIGPLFFSYVISLIRPNSFWVKHWKYHIASWFSAIVLLLIFIPFSTYNELNKVVVLPIINFQWLAFIVLSVIYLKVSSKNSVASALQIKWLLSLTVATVIIWSSYAFIPFEYFVSGSIIYSILFYGFFLFFLIKKKMVSKVFKRVKSNNTSTHSEKNDLLIRQLHQYMLDERLFANPDLKLSVVAKKLDISAHELSKLINDNLNKNFTDFINEYRIEEAKLLITNNSLYTIEAIGNQSGFNSKSAFYKAFKKVTNTTPAKFKEQQ